MAACIVRGRPLRALTSCAAAAPRSFATRPHNPNTPPNPVQLERALQTGTLQGKAWVVRSALRRRPYHATVMALAGILNLKRDAPFTVEVWNVWLAHCGFLRSLPLLEEVRGHMLDDRCPGDVATFTTLMAAYGRAGRLEEVEATWEEMGQRRIAPNVYAYNARLDAHAKHGAAGRVEALWAEMLAAGIVPSVSSYTVRLELYGRQKDVPRMRELLEEVRAAGIKLDPVWYGAVVVHFGRARALDDVLAAMDEHRQADGQVDPLVWQRLLLVCGELGAFGPVDAMLEELRREGGALDEGMANELVAAYAWNNRVEEAERWLRQLEQHLRRPYQSTLRALTTMYAVRGDEAKLRRWQGRLHDQPTKGATLAA